MNFVFPQSLVESELNTVINMSSLVISQMLLSGQEAGVELNVDTTAVENQVRLILNETRTLVFKDPCTVTSRSHR
jgi:hypothetical protein